MNAKQIFHSISYLQYPFMLFAIYFMAKPYFGDFETKEEHVAAILNGINSTLIFMGLGISLSTLQDTTKTQNEMSRKIWESPQKGKLFLIGLSLLTFALISFGLSLYFFSLVDKLEEISIGIIVLGIGLIGLLKTALEMFENHRRDKNPIDPQRS